MPMLTLDDYHRDENWRHINEAFFKAFPTMFKGKVVLDMINSALPRGGGKKKRKTKSTKTKSTKSKSAKTKSAKTKSAKSKTKSTAKPKRCTAKCASTGKRCKRTSTRAKCHQHRK